MTKRFVATLRAIFTADDEVEAMLIAENIRDKGAEDLEDEEGDTLDVTQVTGSGLHLEPIEFLDLLKKCRNALIKTRVRHCIDIAGELDKIIHILKHKEEPQLVLANYSHGDFLDIVTSILDGEEPNAGT